MPRGSLKPAGRLASYLDLFPIIENPSALVKQIKACVARADKFASDADYWRHKAGVQLIKLKAKCAHGEWNPYLKTIGKALTGFLGNIGIFGRFGVNG